MVFFHASTSGRPCMRIKSKSSEKRGSRKADLAAVEDIGFRTCQDKARQTPRSQSYRRQLLEPPLSMCHCGRSRSGFRFLNRLACVDGPSGCRLAKTGERTVAVRSRGGSGGDSQHGEKPPGDPHAATRASWTAWPWWRRLPRAAISRKIASTALAG